MVVHTVLFHGKFILDRWRRSRDDMRDIHQEMMDKVSSVPTCNITYLQSLTSFQVPKSACLVVHSPTSDLYWAFIRHYLCLSHGDELVGLDSCIHHQFRVSQICVLAFPMLVEMMLTIYATAGSYLLGSFKQSPMYSLVSTCLPSS